MYVRMRACMHVCGGGGGGKVESVPSVCKEKTPYVSRHKFLFIKTNQNNLLVATSSDTQLHFCRPDMT